MDGISVTITSLAIIAIVVLSVAFVCHYMGPRATAWVRSNREEKVGLSKSKLFNANGYMIHSGSDFLLSSSGSFKRFDSIDRDYKQVEHSTVTPPAWDLLQTEIPPQPLRPAPAPAPAKINARSFSSPTELRNGVHRPCNRQLSLGSPQSPPIKSHNVIMSTVIPRPTAKRQVSAPSAHTHNGSLRNGSDRSNGGKITINLAEAAAIIQNNTGNNESTFKNTPPSSPAKTIGSGGGIANTNPFLNGTLASLPEHLDNLHNCDIEREEPRHESMVSIERVNDNEPIIVPAGGSNPFTTNPDAKQSSSNDDEVVLVEINEEKSSELLPLNENIRVECKTDLNIETTKKDPWMSEAESLMQTNCNGQTAKYVDSPCSDVFDGFEKYLKNQYRNRSFSETEATELDLKKIAKSGSIKTTSGTNPFLDKSFGGLYKTISEDYLAKSYNGNHVWTFGARSLSRQDSGFSLGRRNSSQGSLDSDRGSLESVNIQRAISCDSVNSESSVVLADLEQPIPSITGYLCVGLQYDKNSARDDGVDLVVTVMEAKELIGPSNIESFDTFVRIYLVPDETSAMQTKLFKNSPSPSYNETFCFWLNKKRGRHSLWFHLYHSGTAHTLIGEAEMQISDVTRPLTTWLPLSDSRQHTAKWGELMFSLSYLPTAERLTIVVVKGRNLQLDQEETAARDSILDSQTIFVKVYLLKDDKKVSKKKTSLKRIDRCPIFNESMIFSIPPYALNSIQVRLTVMSSTDAGMTVVGHVIVGSSSCGKGLRHWHQMLTSLRKPVAMWHALRRSKSYLMRNGIT